MSEVLVVIGASGLQGTLRDYVFQLSRAGIAVALADPSSTPNLSGGGQLAYKLAVWRDLARRFSGFSSLVLSDGFDITFYGSSAAEVAARIPRDRVLLAAEKNCYPDPGIAPRIPDHGPWRFANGGLTAGTPASIIEFCDRVERHPGYRPDMLDQQMLNMLLADQADFFELDHHTRLFFCLYGGYDELQFHQGAPLNTFYDSWPLFIHANGHWSAEEMFARWKDSLACPTIPG